jgi:hypothetical protein
MIPFSCHIYKLIQSRFKIKVTPTDIQQEHQKIQMKGYGTPGKLLWEVSVSQFEKCWFMKCTETSTLGLIMD